MSRSPRRSLGSAFLGLILLSCVTVPSAQVWGDECMREMDLDARELWVRRIADSGDPRAVPVLIDCFEEALRRGKVEAEQGPERKALERVAGRVFGPDIAAWRKWWVSLRGRLSWDAAAGLFREP